MRIQNTLAVLVLAVTSFGCTAGDDTARAERGSTAARERGAPTGAPRSCSRKRVARKSSDVGAVAFARGREPVYVGLGTPDIVRYTEDTRKHKGWYYYKTLWAIAPEYGGEVTITGHEIGGPNELRFNAASGFPGEKLSELYFPDSGEHEWRYGPSDTLIRSAGCYALRIEGEDFVEWVTFIARA
jgi:hypothetical protein